MSFLPATHKFYSDHAAHPHRLSSTHLLLVSKALLLVVSCGRCAVASGYLSVIILYSAAAYIAKPFSNPTLPVSVLIPDFSREKHRIFLKTQNPNKKNQNPKPKTQNPKL
jgi:hypothetical protein